MTFERGTSSSLGSTELQDVDVCLRLYWYKHILKLSPALNPKEDRAFRGRMIGTLLHVCLRYWYAQFMPGGPPAWWYEKSCETALNEAGAGFPKLIELAKEIFTAYIGRFGVEDRRWKVIGVEEEATASIQELLANAVFNRAMERDATALLKLHQELGEPLPSPSKRADLMIERDDGVQFELDYKSTRGWYDALPQWTPMNEFGLHWQAMLYLTIGRIAKNADGQLKYPRLRAFMVQRIRTTPDAHGNYQMDRHEIEMTQAAYREIPEVTLRQLRKRAEVRHAIASEDYGMDGPPGSYWACFQRGRCPYFAVCRSEDRAQALYEICSP